MYELINELMNFKCSVRVRKSNPVLKNRTEPNSNKKVRKLK